jgi:hypothetical protein
MFFMIGFIVCQYARPLRYVDPLDRMPAHYNDYAAFQNTSPFLCNIVSSRDATRDDLVVIIVNDSLYPRIQDAVTRYVQDLTNEAYSTLLIRVMGGTPEDIRDLLITQLPNSLVGAVMIGDLPVAWWEDSNYGEDYPVDFYFTDLNGSWTDSNGNGIYDVHSGSEAPDIWVGRLYASRLTYDEEARLINTYFNINHQYRTGVLVLPDKGLVYNEVTWSPNDHGMGNLYSDVTVVNSENTTTAYDYKSRLDQEYQFVHLVAHSSCWAHTFFLQNDMPGGGSVFSFEIPFVDPKAFFFFLNCCMAARFTETNDLANWYLFSHSYTQVVIASSSLMYGINSMANFYSALASGSTFGDAFKTWHQANYYMFMGTLVLGDPSLTVLTSAQRPVSGKEARYSGTMLADWTTYQVENSQFVNGHPSLGNCQNGVWVFWDSGRIVRSDTYGSLFTGSGFAPAESIAWHEYYDFFPATATDHSGRQWVAWQSFRDYTQYYDHFNIYTTYYNNGSWSAPQYVRPMGGWHDVQPVLAAGSDDTVWIAFKSYRDGNANIYVSKAASGGIWSNSYALTTTNEDETDPAIVVDQDDNVWVFWTKSSSGHSLIYGRKYTGVWQDAFLVDSGCADNAGLNAAVDSLNRVWLIWHRWVNDQSEIYYSYFDGASWLSAAPVTSDNADDILPSITIDEFGRPWICWMSDRDGDWNVYSSCYDNGWKTPGVVTSDPVNDIDPVIMGDDQSRVWVSWVSDRNGYWNVFAACTDVTGVQEHLPVADQRTGIQVAPNPFKDAVVFTSSIPVDIALYNSAGRLVAELTGTTAVHRWAPEGLSPGAYFARIKTADREEYRKIIYLR